VALRNNTRRVLEGKSSASPSPGVAVYGVKAGPSPSPGVAVYGVKAGPPGADEKTGNPSPTLAAVQAGTRAEQVPFWLLREGSSTTSEGSTMTTSTTNVKDNPKTEGDTGQWCPNGDRVSENLFLPKMTGTELNHQLIRPAENNHARQIDDGFDNGFDDVFLATGERHGRSSDARWIGAAGDKSWFVGGGRQGNNANAKCNDTKDKHNDAEDGDGTDVTRNQAEKRHPEVFG
jgi:hypothetical protein